MTIEKLRKEEKVGDFIDLDKKRGVIVFENSDGVTVEYTEESFAMRGLSIEGDKVMKEVETEICMECANDKIFYDSEKEEYYCPVCEQ